MSVSIAAFAFRLVEQELVDIRNRDIGLHVPEDVEAGLDGELRLGREKRILPAAFRSLTPPYRQ